MIFQWYIFVLIFIVAFIAQKTGQRQLVDSYGQQEYRYRWIPVLAITLPLIYLAGTRGNRIGDTAAYRNTFRNLPESLAELPDYLTDDMKDKGFTIVSTFIKSIIGNHDVIYFMIIAAVCLLCVAYVYKKYSSNFFMSMFLFVASADYIQWTYNGVRQFIAAAVLFAGIGLFLKKKYIPLIVLILLLSTIHASALIVLPFVFIVRGKPWNIKMSVFLCVVLFAMLFVNQFTDLITNVMENTQYSGSINDFLNTRGTNLLRVLVFSMPALIALIFKKKIAAFNNPLIDLSVGMSIATMGWYLISAFTSGIFIGRIPIFFSLYNYILLPWEIKNLFDEKTSRFLSVLMICCYMVFYYYQVHITWQL